MDNPFSRHHIQRKPLLKKLVNKSEDILQKVREQRNSFTANILSHLEIIIVNLQKIDKNYTSTYSDIERLLIINNEPSKSNKLITSISTAITQENKLIEETLKIADEVHNNAQDLRSHDQSASDELKKELYRLEYFTYQLHIMLTHLYKEDCEVESITQKFQQLTAFRNSKTKEENIDQLIQACRVSRKLVDQNIELRPLIDELEPELKRIKAEYTQLHEKKVSYLDFKKVTQLLHELHEERKSISHTITIVDKLYDKTKTILNNTSPVKNKLLIAIGRIHATMRALYSSEEEFESELSKAREHAEDLARIIEQQELELENATKAA